MSSEDRISQVKQIEKGHRIETDRKMSVIGKETTALQSPRKHQFLSMRIDKRKITELFVVSHHLSMSNVLV